MLHLHIERLLFQHHGQRSQQWTNCKRIHGILGHQRLYHSAFTTHNTCLVSMTKFIVLNVVLLKYCKKINNRKPFQIKSWNGCNHSCNGCAQRSDGAVCVSARRGGRGGSGAEGGRRRGGRKGRVRVTASQPG